MNLQSLRGDACVAALYAALGMGLLAPQAANTVLPDVYDIPNHVGTIVQAKAALDEAQFPLRVAPWSHGGWRYPLFQFYSPLPYTVAGLLHKFMVPANPYLAYKMTLLLALTLGGTFIYKLARGLAGSRPAAVLAGALYIAAPYSLINLHARGAFTETVAQELLAVVAYYTFRGYASPRIRFRVLAALWWCALALTHLITFSYSILFLGLVLALLSMRGRRGPRRLLRAASAGAWGVVLAAPFLVPVATTPYLRMHHPGYLVNPYTRAWLTPLSGLLSPASVPPEPLPGHDYGTPYLHPAVGWPLLLAAGAVLYRLLERRRRGEKGARSVGFAAPLLAAYGLALFATWSPIDFWSALPRFLHLAQFTYRFLTHVMWTGALLGALALAWTFGRLDGRHTLVGLLLIGLSSSSYLPTPRTSPRSIEEVMRRPEVGLYGVTFLPEQTAFGHLPRPALPIRPVAETQPACRQLGSTTSCLVTVTEPTLVELPVLFYPDLIDLRVDGRRASYFPVARGDYLLAAAEVPVGTHEIRARFSGLRVANWLAILAWMATLAVLVPAWRRRRIRSRRLTRVSEVPPAASSDPERTRGW